MIKENIDFKLEDNKKIKLNMWQYNKSIIEKAMTPKTWEDAQKSLEAATKFGEQIGNMM